jgi:starvation-inducible DNA-binding protein
MKEITGIDAAKTNEIVAELNQLLADYHIYYQNLRGFHWNINGPGFFELHRHFEELYTVALVTIDEVAERILTLGGSPLHTMSDYVKHSEIKEQNDTHTAEATVKATLEALKVLLTQERKLVEIAAEAADEGTVDLLTPLIAAQEKEAWMLRAYLGK